MPTVSATFDAAEVFWISLIQSSNSTDIDVPRSTDLDAATDMSGHEVA